ncbi:MAG: OmpA family protein [Cytophagales bacterium]|nr:OmpA family protein [Cytophagales bacterium]
MKLNQFIFSVIFSTLMCMLSTTSFAQGNANTERKILNICSSIFDEFAPSLSADGKTLIFQSNKDGEYKLYESRLNAPGQWSEPLPLTKVNNYGKSKDLVAGPSISYDGNTMFFCASYASGWGDLDIYYSERKGSDWGEPVNLGKPVNSSDYEGFPSISADGNKLFFVRLLPQKIEGMDCFKIMVSEKDKKGKWGLPRVLPPPVNFECDKAPRILTDNKTLLFSSIRPNGKGKFDLYTSKITETGEWTEPLPMEFVNSPELEQYATVPASGDYMYYHSNGNIVNITIPFKYRQNKNITLQGFVTDLDTKAPLGANITVKDASTTEILSLTQNNPSDGRYTVVLSAGKRYEVSITKPGYSVHSTEYDLVNLTDYKEYNGDVQLFSKINFTLSVIDYDLFFPLVADVFVKNALTGQQINIAPVKNSSGSMLYKLPIGQKYNFNIESGKYAPYNFNFDLTNEIKYRDYEKEVEMGAKKKQFLINLSDAETGGLLSFDVLITNLDMDEQVVAQATMTRDGKYAINLREGGRYKVEVKNQKGYAFYTTEIDVNSSATSLTIGMTALKANAKLKLKDITFEYNSYELNDNSFPELNRAIQMIKDNPGMVVEVAAHTDGIGGDVFNKKLSERRANYVVDYMVVRKIPVSRIKPVGYGKTQPIAPNDTEENRAKNRRLELKILSVN